MQERNQELYPYHTDEIDLRKLFNTLLARKLFILCFTGLVTLLAIIYALNLTPTYKATTSFTAPSDYSILYINRLPLTSETNNSVFSNFLSLLSSREFQTKVFLDGDYLTALNPENEPIDDVKDYALGFLSSISVGVPPFTRQSKDEIISGNLLERPYSISMEGSNGEIISRYLNEVVTAADNKTMSELISLIRHKIDIRLEQISTKRKLLLVKAKQERLYEIEVLESAASIAKSLGIIDNNFNQISNDKFDTNLFIAIGENQMLPDWYLYGEKALLERIKILKNRSIDDPYIPEIIVLDNETRALQSFVIDTSGINSMQLNQTAFNTMTMPSKIQIVLIAFFAGFMMSILLAIAMEALKSEEKNSA